MTHLADSCLRFSKPNRDYNYTFVNIDFSVFQSHSDSFHSLFSLLLSLIQHRRQMNLHINLVAIATKIITVTIKAMASNK